MVLWTAQRHLTSGGSTAQLTTPPSLLRCLAAVPGNGSKSSLLIKHVLDAWTGMSFFFSSIDQLRSQTFIISCVRFRLFPFRAFVSLLYPLPPFFSAMECSDFGSLRRCGGQGDVLAGRSVSG